MTGRHEGFAFLTKRDKRIGWIAALLLALLLVYAWIDGGEEPMRSMAEPVEVPESAL